MAAYMLYNRSTNLNRNTIEVEHGRKYVVQNLEQPLQKLTEDHNKIIQQYILSNTVSGKVARGSREGRR